MHCDILCEVPALYGLKVENLPAKLPTPDLDDLVRLNQSGKTTKEIAVIYGVHVITVRRWFKRNGLVVRQDLGGSHQLSPERRRAVITRAAKANTGRKRSDAAKEAKARTCELRQTHISPLETELADMLRARGIAVTQQKAVGPYNVDIASGSVAVEVFGGGWHNTHRDGKRLRYLLDRGWSTVVVWVDAQRYPLTVGAAEYVIAHLELSERDPAAASGYRVVWGTGQVLSTGSPDPDDIPDVLTTAYRLDFPETIPYGTCHCGCGEQTWIATQGNVKRGWIRGEPVKWTRGHVPRRTTWTVGEDGRRQYAR